MLLIRIGVKNISTTLIKKDGLKLLVNIHDYILEVIELPENTNDKKFIYGKNIFKQFKKIDITK